MQNAKGAAVRTNYFQIDVFKPTIVHTAIQKPHSMFYLDLKGLTVEFDTASNGAEHATVTDDDVNDDNYTVDDLVVGWQLKGPLPFFFKSS